MPHIPVIPAVERLRQDSQESEVKMSYRVRLCLSTNDQMEEMGERRKGERGRRKGKGVMTEIGNRGRYTASPEFLKVI